MVTRLARGHVLRAPGLIGDAAWHKAAFVKEGPYVSALRRIPLGAGYCQGFV